RSDAKYTIVAWRDGGKPADAVVRTPLKELLEQLDAEQFAQVHRSVVVNLRAISHVKRHDNETAEIHVRGRDDVTMGSIAGVSPRSIRSSLRRSWRGVCGQPRP
ncbi:MAG: hypothetical protein DMG04_10530, partial [Acidobacteria bacterium]